MKYGVDLVVMHDESHKLEVEDVALDEFEVRALEGGAQILQIRAIVKDIETDKENIGILLGHEVADVGADEARAPGDEDVLRDVVGRIGHVVF
jgi:hypothetical protein